MRKNIQNPTWMEHCDAVLTTVLNHTLLMLLSAACISDSGAICNKKKGRTEENSISPF